MVFRAGPLPGERRTEPREGPGPGFRLPGLGQLCRARAWPATPTARHAGPQRALELLWPRPRSGPGAQGGGQRAGAQARAGQAGARAAAAATRCCRAWGCTWTPWSRRPRTSSAPHPFWPPPRPPHPWRWPHAPVCGTWPGGSGTRLRGHSDLSVRGRQARVKPPSGRGPVAITTNQPESWPPAPPLLAGLLISQPHSPAPLSLPPGPQRLPLGIAPAPCRHPGFSASGPGLGLRSPRLPKPLPQFLP